MRKTTTLLLAFTLMAAFQRPSMAQEGPDRPPGVPVAPPSGQGTPQQAPAPAAVFQQPSGLAQPPTPTPTPAPPAGHAGENAKGPPPQGQVVRYNGADLSEVIHTLAKIAGISYMVDGRVKGTVNLYVQGPIRREDALDLLQAVLLANGASAVEQGGIYHIVPAQEAKGEAVEMSRKGQDLVQGQSPKPLQRPSDRLSIRVFPLQYMSASEMAKVLKPFLSPAGEATEIARGNSVLVVDTSANMEKHADLVDTFDSDLYRASSIQAVRLKFLDPDEMARLLDSVFGAMNLSDKSGKPVGFNFIPVARLNAVLVVAGTQRGMAEATRWISEFDKEPSTASRAIHVYRVRHGESRDLYDVLSKIYPGRTSVRQEKSTEFRPQAGEPVFRDVLDALKTSSSSMSKQTSAAASTSAPAAPAASAPPAAPSPAQQGPSARESSKGTGASDEIGFQIILDERVNAILIHGNASEYAKVLDTLNKIDVYPKQVLLEVLVAEVKLDDDLKLGVDWKYMWEKDGASQSVGVSSSLPVAPALNFVPTGLRYVVDKTDRLTGAVRALAKDGKLSILSSPSVIAYNGKKARIDVSDSVPVVNGSVTTTTGTALTTQSIEYRDVGVILSFVPSANEDNMVTLQISQEVSDISQISFGNSNNPSFFKRTVQTTLMARSDHTIVIGGLVKERNERSTEGVPLLSRIPLIGWLFGSQTGSASRAELMVFITPRVVSSEEDAVRISNDYENRVDELKARINQTKGLRPRAVGLSPGK